jgi:hypothetical protein
MRYFAPILCCALCLAALADDAPAPRANDDLARRQERIASKYSQLEDLMLRMAQLEAATNPRRAALLTQAIETSKKNHTKLDLEKIAEFLGKRRLKDALDGQVKAEKSLEDLLKLLQSEDRGERNKSEQERIKEYIKEVDRMIRIERSLQGQNEGGGDTKRIAEEQAKLAERAGDLADKIKENEEVEAESKETSEDKKPGDEARPNDSEKRPGENKPNEGKPDESKPAEDKPGETKPAEEKPGESKPGESKPGENKPGENKPSEMPPMDGQQNSDSEQPQDQQKQQQNPVREKIEQAQQRMKAAQQKLEQAQRKESIEEQQKAREELEKAKAELEKILKQLREEEMERTLQALEARFRKMLEMQVKVFEGTKKLDAIPVDERTREADVQAGRLGGDEAKIAIEAEKAMQLLEEEGSSVAFPATVEQMADDMRQVSERLNQGKTDTITQGLEEEIIATLEELLAAMEQAQKKLEEQKEQPPQQQQQQQGQQEQPLVDAIQELKMIKSLQLRVNKRTDRYAKLLQDQSDPIGQANTKELFDALDKLSEKQQQVFEIVRNIVVGKNK